MGVVGFGGTPNSGGASPSKQQHPPVDSARPCRACMCWGCGERRPAHMQRVAFAQPAGVWKATQGSAQADTGFRASSRRGRAFRCPCWQSPPPRRKESSVGPFGYACAPLYASEHVKQRALGQEPTGRQSILTSHLVHAPFTTKATDSRTHAKQSGGLLDSDALTGQYSQTRVRSTGRERRRPPE
jgi:hypothetical protein